jgi:hypothetical protein
VLALNPAYNQTAKITVDALNQLFGNILKDYDPIFHSKQTVFVSNLPKEHQYLLKQTKDARHKFVFNKDATKKAMSNFLNPMPYEMFDL